MYLISNKDLLTHTLASSAEATVFHTYIGYAGWSAGQLEHEVDLGAWHIMPADAGDGVSRRSRFGVAAPDSPNRNADRPRCFTYTPPLRSLAPR